MMFLLVTRYFDLLMKLYFERLGTKMRMLRIDKLHKRL